MDIWSCNSNYSISAERLHTITPLTVLTATMSLSGVSGTIPSACAFMTFPKAPFPVLHIIRFAHFILFDKYHASDTIIDIPYSFMHRSPSHLFTLT